MTAPASLYEGYLDYKGPKDKHFKSYFAQLLPKQLLLKEDIHTSEQPKSVYIQPGKYGEGKSNDKKKIYEFYMDGMTGRHNFKVTVMSQRKAWLEYFKIADEQLEIGVYDQVMVHTTKQRLPQAGYGNIEGSGRHVGLPASYSTLPATAASSQHYAASHGSHTTPSNYASHTSPQHHGKRNVGTKTNTHTIPSSKGRDVSLPIEDVPPPLPPGREDVPPPLPPGREDIPPPLPPEREDVPPPLPPGREEFSPPLPPGREVPPPLPPGRDDVPPPLPPGREFTPPLPPGRPEEGPPHSAPVSGRVKLQGFGFPISPVDLQKAHSNISDGGTQHGRLTGHKLDKRDSGNVSGDGTILHSSLGDGRAHHVIKVMSKSAPSSCEGQFGSRNYRDEGCPTSADSTPYNSGGGTITIAKDHLHFKWCVEGIGREKAEELVKSEQDGTLLYRINGDKHVITIKRTDKIYHHLVDQQDGKYIFKGLDVTGNSVYNIVSNYLQHCKGKVTPYGGSIDAKKEGHEDYDKPWNPPDVKILVSQVAKELEKKQKKRGGKQESPPSSTGGRRLSAGSKSAPEKPKSTSSLPLRKSSKGSKPVSMPIVEDEQTDYVNEGEDVVEDEIYENTEPEELYLNTPGKDAIYQNTTDISKTNVDSKDTYMNLSKQRPSSATKLPKSTPRMPGGDKYMNVAAERVQDVPYAYSDSDHYLKLKVEGMIESDDVYEPMDH